MLSLFFYTCIVFLTLVPTLWLLGMPFSLLFSWSKKLKPTEKIFYSVLLGILVLSLLNYIFLLLNIQQYHLGDLDSSINPVFLVYGLILILWLPILFNRKSFAIIKYHRREIEMALKNKEIWNRIKPHFFTSIYLFTIMLVYIFFVSFAMGADGFLHTHTDNHFHSILVKLYMDNGQISSSWKPYWSFPVIYPQGAHGIAGFIGIVISIFLGQQPESLDAARHTMSFEIVISALTIASVYLLTCRLIKDKRVALLTPLVLAFLGRTFITTYHLFSWVPWGGIAEITVVCILPLTLVMFLNSEKSIRSKDLWLTGIFFGAGLMIHTHLLFYFLTAIGLYYPTIWLIRWKTEHPYSIISKSELSDIRKGFILLTIGIVLIIPIYFWIATHMTPSKLTNPYPSYRALVTVLQEIAGYPLEITTYLALLAIWKIYKEKQEDLFLLLGWCASSLGLGIFLGIFLWINDRRIPIVELVQPYRLESLIFIPRLILASIGLIIIFDYTKKSDFHITLESKRFQFIQNHFFLKKRNIAYLLAILLAINIGFTVGGMVIFPRQSVSSNDIEAYDWLEQNTPSDAYILNDESGFWIPTITGRKIAFPNIDAADRILISENIWNLYEQLNSLNASNGEEAGEFEYEMMLREGLDYIFISPYSEYSSEYSMTVAWANIPAGIFNNTKFFIPMYLNSTLIYKIHDLS